VVRATAAARRPPVGVLGGMGPLVSAEFVKTIYEQPFDGPEQNAPHVVLHSDPSMPDRTSAFLNGAADTVLPRFVEALARLDREGVSNIVICCITAHYLLPRLPDALRGRIVSLLDVVAEAVAANPQRHLLLCTTGTRRLGLFEAHPEWPSMKDRLVMPDDADQAEIHRTIYEIKERGDVQMLTRLVERLLAKYGVESFVAGCTEIHFASKRLGGRREGDGGFGCVDPLLIVAERVARGQI
jgi:aspartate racemase